jgi:hypothetical protein
MVDASKAALAYLANSGAAAISVIADVDGAAIRVGFDAGDADVVEVFWIPAAKARSIAARGRHIAGPGLEVDDAVAAIRSAAAESRTTITLHDVAIARAAEMASALDLMAAEMQANGQLKAFNQQFRARRSAAAANGHGFMSYRVAELRLRKALIPALASSGGNARAVAAQFQFAAAFETS